MSNFTCEKCNKDIIDSESGYVTGCEHYPVEQKLFGKVVNLSNSYTVPYDVIEKERLFLMEMDSETNKTK